MSIEYRKLGNTGTIVTKFCLGTMTFGAESDEATSHRLLDDYAKAGGNFIDTADVYSTGVSETIIGKWLKGHPTEAKQMVVATKARFPMGPGPNDIGISRRHLSEALDASLRRLGLQRIFAHLDQLWASILRACLFVFFATLLGASLTELSPTERDALDRTIRPASLALEPEPVAQPSGPEVAKARALVS